MTGAGAIRAGLAVVELGADLSLLQQGLDRAASMMRGYATKVAAVGASFAAAGAAITAPITAAFKGAVEQGSSIGTLATQLGTTAEEASRLQYAFSQFGVSQEEVVGFARHMSHAMAELASGVPETVQKFALLGISLEDLRQMSLTEQFAAVGGQISKATEQFDRMNKSVELFGRNGPASLTAFANGAAGLKAKLAEADTIGATVTSEQARQAKEVSRAWGQMQNAVRFAFLEVGRALLPSSAAIAGYAQTVMAVARSVRVWIGENKALVAGALAVGMALSAAGAALVGIAVLGPTVLSALSVLAPVVTLAWTAGAAAIGAAWSAAAALVGATWGGLGAVLLAPIGLAVAALGKVAAVASAIGAALLSPVAIIGGLGALFLAQTGAAESMGRTATGAAAEMGRGLRGAFGVLKDEGPAAWNALRETATRTWGEITAALRRGDVAGAFSAAMSGLGSAFDVVRDLAGKVWEPLWQGAQEAWGKIREGATETWARIKGAFAGLGSGEGLLSKVLLGSGAALAATTALNPALAPIAAVQAAVAGLGYYFATETETGRRWGKAVADAARGAATVIKDEVGRQLGIVAEEGAAAWGTIRGAAVTATGGIVAALQRGDIGAALNVAILGLKVAWHALVDFFRNSWDRITAPAYEAFYRIKDGLREVGADVMDFLRPGLDAAAEAWDQMVESFQDVRYRLGKMFNDLGDELKTALVALGGPVSAAVAAIVGAFGFLKPYFEELGEGLADNWGSIFSRIATMVQRIMYDMIAAIFNKLAEATEAIANSRAAKLAGLSGKLGGFAATLRESAEGASAASEEAKQGQKSREKKRRDEREAKKKERDDNEFFADAERQLSREDERGELEDATAAEREKTKKAREEAQKRRDDDEFYAHVQQQFDLSMTEDNARKASGAQAAAKEVKGLSGAQFTSTGGNVAQALGVGSQRADREILTTANKQLDVLNKIADNTAEGGLT